MLKLVDRCPPKVQQLSRMPDIFFISPRVGYAKMFKKYVKYVYLINYLAFQGVLVPPMVA